MFWHPAAEELNLSFKKILVTGGAGYIGSHTVKELLRQGCDTVTLDNLSTGHRESICGGVFVEADLRNLQALRDTLSSHRIDAVIHFAASCYVGESVKEPIKYYENNVLCGMNLLSAMAERNVRYIIFSSSAAVYGNPVQVPIPEEHQQLPINPYGQTKSLFEDILKSHERLYGIRSVSLRYFNAGGCDPDGDIGEHHDPETHLIPLVLDTALGRLPKISIFGDDYPTPDGTCIRDFIHVTDLADAHIRSLEYLSGGGATTALNVGTGKGYSVKEVIRAAEQVCGRSIAHTVSSRRPGDPPVLVAAADRIRREIGWEPRRSSLEEILETAWRWQKKLRKSSDRARPSHSD
ncbi:MAG: UDP-glucose 4-epimerase GalE [Candidatus Abyssobacteria bacterium SURF_5]|uniref:UDP-glucose 4-epimerase n=1 Tax=Abyssobacteria bacterium (strain SURF_5) TaxID=2093360 RepID=A0A3A4P8D9_ABYX5|nr:MAG: UDP-glucose 4-epimerase GalE [Candidatus Abyssubacteria bacterium SURF_5]